MTTLSRTRVVRTTAAGAKASAMIESQLTANTLRFDVSPTSEVQRVFLKRAIGALVRISEGDQRALAQALEAPTDVGTLAYALSAAAATPAVAELDPEAALLAEGARIKAELVSRAGGTLGAGAVAAVLGVSRQAVDKRRRANRLLAVPVGTGYAYPACQFSGSGLVQGLDRVLVALPIADPWMRLDWLLAEDEALGGESPLEALQNSDLDAVMGIASSYGA